MLATQPSPGFKWPLLPKLLDTWSYLKVGLTSGNFAQVDGLERLGKPLLPSPLKVNSLFWQPYGAHGYQANRWILGAN